ncbi:MAG: hypothetical protein AB7O60_04080 [Variibacter sp.]
MRNEDASKHSSVVLLLILQKTKAHYVIGSLNRNRMRIQASLMPPRTLSWRVATVRQCSMLWEALHQFRLRQRLLSKHGPRRLRPRKGMKMLKPNDALRTFMISKAVPNWDAFAAKVPGAREILEKYRAAAKK